MNILRVMSKRQEPCTGFLKMLNLSKSLHCMYPEEPNHTLHKCPYNGRLIQELWDEQQKKKKKINPDEIVPAATQRRKDNIGVDTR